jgi:multidrug efflux pump subunit AcrA (membrane-fusion protein)
MKASSAMPKMPSGAPAGSAEMPQNIPAGQSSQGMPSAAAMAAMNSDPKTKTVWLKDDKMGIRPNRIKIGIDNGTNVEVLSGLKEGDEVVISSGDNEAKSTAKKTDNGPPGFPF